MLWNCGVVEDKSLLDCKEIQQVHPKGGQSWVFTGRTDVEAETQIFWLPDGKSWLIWKYHDAGKDWGQEKGMTEDEMVGWHHWLNGHGFGWTPGVGDGQGGLVCCSSWGGKESDTTEHLNWTELNRPGEFIFQCPVFCLFILFMEVSRQGYWSDLAFPSPMDHILSELSTMTRPSWVALHGMAHSFIELDKAVVHVIRLVSFLWLWSSVYTLLEQPWRDIPCPRSEKSQ